MTTALPPGPPLSGALRHLRSFGRTPLRLLHEMHAGYGDLVSLRIGPKRFYLAAHPDHARRVLVENGANYPKSRFVFNRIRSVTGETGLVQLDGENWEKTRAATNAAFTAERLEAYLDPIHRCVDDLMTEMKDGEPIDVSAAMTALILRTAGMIFLDHDLGAKTGELGEAFLQANRESGKRLRATLALPQPLGTSARRYLDRFFRVSRKDRPTSPHRLVYLLRDQLPAGIALSDQLRTFLFAGHETTAASLAWTLHLLSRHPEAQTRVAEEAGRIDKLDDVKRLRYTRAVYQESLRLFPPAWILARDIKSDDQLGNYRVRAGATLLVNLRRIHRHPDFWERPDEFLPERFLGSGGRHPQAFIPFGAGPRICSGTSLAMIEAVVVLARLFARFRFSPTRNHVEEEAMITLHPKDGIWLNPRSN